MNFMRTILNRAALGKFNNILEEFVCFLNGRFRDEAQSRKHKQHKINLK